jgi:hypothetical protein
MALLDGCWVGSSEGILPGFIEEFLHSYLGMEDVVWLGVAEGFWMCLADGCWADIEEGAMEEVFSCGCRL